MSARLLTVLILPTLLLAVALAPSHAAQQPTEPVKPPKAVETSKIRLVTKVYEVADLVIPLAANETPPQDNTKSCVTCTRGRATSAVQLYMRERGKTCPKIACCETAPSTCEDQLIALIKTAISPMAWNDAGGDWSLEYFPLTHALVINAPPDAQEQIMELLQALRRLQDQEVALEIRFLHVSDEFYKHLKDDFNFKECKGCPMASLDDKQLFCFMEATQGDKQTHIMQAPKITMFTGQQSTLRLLETRTFATSMALRWSEDFKTLLPSPLNEVMQFGLEMNLNPVISADKQTVKLEMNLKNTRLQSEDVEIIPTHLVFLDPCKESQETYLKIYQPVASIDKIPTLSKEELGRFIDKHGTIATQWIQKPKIAKVTLDRKMDLPDGKTAVLFGWKQTSEVVDAVPVLSKLPIIGKNYQHKRQVPETVLVLVTPRVIVPQETEEVLPAPKPVQAKAMPKGDAEESEPPVGVDELVTKYHQTCAAGKKDAARKIAIKALKMDPTCFDRKRGE
jgi:hypothetical protein